MLKILTQLYYTFIDLTLVVGFPNQSYYHQVHRAVVEQAVVVAQVGVVVHQELLGHLVQMVLMELRQNTQQFILQMKHQQLEQTESFGSTITKELYIYNTKIQTERIGFQ